MRRMLVVALAIAGCSRSEPKPDPGATPAPQTDPTKAAPTKPDPCAKAEAKPGHGALKWIDDDYASAIACAKATKRPIVLDLWAPWCHTCLSMQTTVFPDKSFEADADKFVFLALDTDRDGNAAAVAKFPPSAWPTFYVIGPDEAVLARFVGGASVEQFHAFMDNGKRAMAGGAQGADAHLLSAERHLQAKQFEDAVRELTAALTDAPKDWPRRADALTSLISAKRKNKDLAGCLELGEKALADNELSTTTASASDFLVDATGCAEEWLKDGAHKKDEPRIKALREKALVAWQKLLDNPAAKISVDDRSDAMANVRETLDALGKNADAKLVANMQLALLDDTAAKAKTPLEAMTYNWPRAEVYAYLGKPLDLVPALEKSAKDLPAEYDPPARLGWIYLKGEKYEEAAKWTDKAIGMAYGPRKARVLAQRAEIASKQNDKAGVVKYRELVVKTWEGLPATQVPAGALEKAKQQLEEARGTGSGSSSH